MHAIAPPSPDQLPWLPVRTRMLSEPPDLLGLLPGGAGALSWVRSGDGLVGWGEALRIEVSGPHRFELADHLWRQATACFLTDGEVGESGTGPVAFVSFAFGADPGRSVLVVPRVVVGRRGNRAWLTEAGTGSAAVATDPVADPGPLRWTGSRLSADRWRVAAAEAIALVRAGELDKVVLARDLRAEAADPIDARVVLRRLARQHPTCWTFAVDGLVGATPELLLRRHGDTLSARVLAGTSWPGARAHHQMPRSPAHRAEHRLAVESLTAPLRPHCSTLNIGTPQVLSLRDVDHLATDIRATLAEPATTSLLGLAGAVHPTAAVGGVPTVAAQRVIERLEGRAGLDRGRYAGPVGWIDASGNGELGIALRCAQLSGRHAQLFAGAGLVADSDPDIDLRETEVKFAAMRNALLGPGQTTRRP